MGDHSYIPVQFNETYQYRSRKGEKTMATKEKMNTNRKIAIIVGILFIIATAATVLSSVFTEPLLEAQDYHIQVSANETQMVIGLLSLLVTAIAVVSIAVMMYPLLNRHREIDAVGYLSARIIEGVLLIISVLALLTLMTLSQEFVATGATNTSNLQAGGALLRTVSDWAFSLGVGFIFALSALILNYSLYQSKLVPRWLSAWGFIGAVLILAGHLLGYFNVNPLGILDIPIALQEMVFAIWLIVKGFNPSAL
jgi:hypothetical protein